MTFNRATFESKKADLEKEIADPSISHDSTKLHRTGKELQRINNILDLDDEHKRLQQEINDLEGIIKSDDGEMKALAEKELPEKKSALQNVEQKFREASTPKDPQDERDVLVEIRAGAGGDEAGLFAVELFRMYSRYAESNKWKVHVLSTSRTGIGGYKEVVAEIYGTDVYGTLKFESGVHRVQRVPETEKSGRVHTSTVTVAIMPIVEEKDISLKPEDLKIEATTSSGHGGQSVNTTYSAIRMTHLPTGIMVSCQDERSQKQNKEKALEIIRSRVYALEQEKRMKEESALRKGQIGTGDRSEKIRTYNFPQDRITDHRIKQNFHNLPLILEGALQPLISALQSASKKTTAE